MAASEPRRITDLETYLCRSFGMSQLALAALLLPLTGLLPTSMDAAAASDSTNSKNPYAQPTLVVTTTYHALTAFYLYANLTYNWNFAFTAGLIGSSVLMCMGIWCLLFGGGQSLSKTTGADKRTSNFPFENKESAKSIKKESKRRSMQRTKSRD